MTKLEFKTLSFSIQNDQLKVNLLKQFYCLIPQIEVEKIAKFKLIDTNTIEFKDIKRRSCLGSRYSFDSSRLL